MEIGSFLPMGESSKILSFFEKNDGFHPYVSSMWKSIFKTESHVGRIFKILKKKYFHFPNGGSNSKFDHPYILEKWNFFQRLLFIFDVFSPYLRLK